MPAERQLRARDHSRINIDTLLVIAISTSMAVDYFLSPNYLPYVELRYPGSGLPVAFDPHTMAFLEQYLMCSLESQKKLFAKVMHAEQPKRCPAGKTSAGQLCPVSPVSNRESFFGHGFCHNERNDTLDCKSEARFLQEMFSRFGIGRIRICL